MRRLLALACLLLAACDSGSTLPTSEKDIAVDPLTQIRANLAFTCKHEEFPEPTADSDKLFKYARWLQKNNLLKEYPAVDAQVERLYRIAAEHGHAKANINLQNGSMQGRFKLRSAEHMRLTQELIEAKVAAGYAFVAIFLKQGAVGLQQDKEMALRYYRKAADMGSPEAQVYVAEKLAPRDMAPDIARQMRRCAAEQGSGKAAVFLSMDLRDNKLYDEAIKILQLGVAAGYESAASRLSDGFRGPNPDNQMSYLGQEEDIERADRYKRIWRFLANYSYASPKVPEINEILPLPPAKLPPWDGKLKWLEERKANVPPPKPDEALIREMAKAKQLDPTNGRPLPASPNFVRLPSPRPQCYSGKACPRGGYWELVGVDNYWIAVEGSTIRRFQQGERMPTVVIERRISRIWPLPDKVIKGPEYVRWVMLGEA